MRLIPTIAHHLARRRPPACATHVARLPQAQLTPTRLLYLIGTREEPEPCTEPGSHLILVEPDPGRAARLAARAVGRACTVVNVALGDTEGLQPFPLRSAGAAGRGTEIGVRVRTLRSLVAEFGVPHLLRVDAAGAQRAAILPLTESSAPRCVVFADGAHALDCILHLNAIGLKAFNIVGGTQAPALLLARAGCGAEELPHAALAGTSAAAVTGGWRDVCEVLRDWSRLARFRGG